MSVAKRSDCEGGEATQTSLPDSFRWPRVFVVCLSASLPSCGSSAAWWMNRGPAHLPLSTRVRRPIGMKQRGGTYLAKIQGVGSRARAPLKWWGKKNRIERKVFICSELSNIRYKKNLGPRFWKLLVPPQVPIGAFIKMSACADGWRLRESSGDFASRDISIASPPDEIISTNTRNLDIVNAEGKLFK